MSAMVETFDAQMTDYSANDDVLMQTHSDPWTQEDGAMEDDSFNSFNQTDVSKLPSMDSIIPIEASASLAFSTISTSNSSLPMGEEQAVEIEMEEDFDGHEYDMVDDDDRVEDIRDIEVQDAQAGVPLPDIIAPQISFTLSSETSTSVAEITSLVTPAPSTYGASRQSPALTHDFTTDQPPHAEENIHPFEHVESSDVVLTQSTSEVPAEVPGPAIEQVQDSVELEHREPPMGSHLATEAAQGDVRHAAEPEPLDREVSPPPSEAAHTSVHTGFDEAEEKHIGPERTEDVVSEVAPVDPHDSHEGAAEEGSNPHEISEGVYIEPPPGVILEVPSSQHSYSLFNRPSYSGHTTPSREEADEGDDSVVLLQDRPTLFYEPIFSVFEALREEEPFHSSPDLRELELMFSFPSLKLVISEDNVYARQSETSLHEVCMLHETFGDSGPLRVQLQLQPRFIIRYSELQSALEQSALGHDGEEGEVHGDDEAVEIVEDASTEHLDLEVPHDEPLEHEVSPQPEQEEDPAVTGADEHHLDPAELSDLNTTNNTPLTQDTHAQAVEEAYEHQEPQSTTHAPTEPTEQAEEQLHEQEQEQEQAEEQEEVEAVVKSDARERDDGDEDRDGEPGASELQNVIGGHVDEEGDLVVYVEEFEELGEHYEEEYEEDSDATETPGDEHVNAEAVDAVDEASTGEYEAHVEEPSPAEGQAVLSSPLDDAQGTDNDGLANDLGADHDAAEDAASSEHAYLQQDAGLGGEQRELGHDEQAEGRAEGDSGHVEPVEEFPDFSELPELPEEEDEFWDDELDGEGEVDASWSNGYEDNEATEQNEESASNDSTVTLSSKGSKRTYSEVDDEYEEEGDNPHPSIPTPEKRTRLQ